MKIKNSMKMIAFSVVALTLFVGCGSSDDGTPPTLTGTFIDSPVQGLGFKTASQSGFTDKDGHFKYRAGEEVEFKLGNLSLGKGAAGTLMTPYSITDNNVTATNIALLLQNFDDDRTDGITNISALKDYDFSDFNISASNAEMQTKLTTLLATANFQTTRGGTEFGLLDATTVKAAMDTYINDNSVKSDMKFTQAYLDTVDFYTIDLEYGSQNIHRLVGGQVYFTGDSYTDHNGVFVQKAGFDGTFNIDGSGVATYTIKDGKLITNEENGTFKTSIVITKISENSITVFLTVIESTIDDITVGTTRTLIWYTNKAAAETAYLKTKGFSEAYLSGKTFYIAVNLDGNIEEFALSFPTQGTMHLKNLVTGTVRVWTTNYTITSNGAIAWIDEDGNQQWDIISIKDNGIEVNAQTTLTQRNPDGTSSQGNVIWYYDISDMKTQATLLRQGN